MGNEKIKSLEDQIKQIQDKQKKIIADNQKRIKNLQEQISNEKKKEAARCEQIIIGMVRDIYGDINEETIQQFQTLLRDNKITLTAAGQREDTDEG